MNVLSLRAQNAAATDGATAARQLVEACAGKRLLEARSLLEQGFTWFGHVPTPKDWGSPAFHAFWAARTVHGGSARAIPSDLIEVCDREKVREVIGGEPSQLEVCLVDVSRGDARSTLGVAVRRSTRKIAATFDPEPLVGILDEARGLMNACLARVSG